MDREELFFFFLFPSALGLSIREICGWRGVAVSGEGSKFLRYELLVHFTGMVCRIQYAKKPHIQTLIGYVYIKLINHYINCHLDNHLILHLSTYSVQLGV